MLSSEEIHQEYFERVYSTQTSGGLHLKALSRLAKQYMILVELSRQASKVTLKDEKAPGLPRAAKRDKLGRRLEGRKQCPTVKRKMELDALARLLALRVANSLMRT